MKSTVLSYFVLCIFSFCLAGQSGLNTVPLVNHYSPEIYNSGLLVKSGAEIHAIAQFNNYLYFANDNGLLIFDGNRWYGMKCSGPIYSIAVDRKKQKVFIGGESFFGYFDDIDPLLMDYIQISDSLSRDSLRFSKIFNISITPLGIFFTAAEDLFLYNRNHIMSIFFTPADSKKSRKPNNIQFSQFIADTLYINCRNNGPSKFSPKGLESYKPELPDCYNRSGMNRILPYNADSVLISTQNLGLIVVANNPKGCPFTEEPPQTILDTLLQTYQVTCALEIGKGYYAVGTKLSGIFLFDRHEKIVYHLSVNNGLPSNNVLSLHQDHLNNLWVGLNNGIAYVELNSPFQKLDYALRLPDKINGFHRQFGNLYIATSNGIYFQHLDTLDNRVILSEIKQVPETKGETWAIHRYNDTHIIVSHENSIYLLDRNHNFIATDIAVRHGTVFEDIPGAKYIIGNGPDGLIRYTRKPGYPGKYFNKKIEGFNQPIKDIIIDSEHNIWITDSRRRLSRLLPNSSFDTVKKIISYSGLRGLPDNEVFMFKMLEEADSKGIIFSNSKNIYNFNKTEDTMDPASFLEGYIAERSQLLDLVVIEGYDKARKYLYLTEMEFGTLEKFPNRDWEKLQYNKPAQYIVTARNAFLPLSPAGFSLIGTNKELWVFDPSYLLFDTLVKNYNIYVKEERIGDKARFIFTTDFFQDFNLIRYKYRVCNNSECQNSSWKEAASFQTEFISLAGRRKFLEVEATNIFGVSKTTIVTIGKKSLYSYLLPFLLLVIIALLVWFRVRLIRKKRKIADQSESIEYLQQKDNKYSRILQNLRESIRNIRLRHEKKIGRNDHFLVTMLEEFEQIVAPSSTDDDVRFIRSFNRDFPKINTDRNNKEAQVAFFIIQGLSNETIADQMGTTKNTVFNYRSAIKHRIEKKDNEVADLDEYLKKYDQKRNDRNKSRD